MRHELRKLSKNSIFIKIVVLLLFLNISVLFYNIQQQDIHKSYCGLEPVLQEMDEEYQSFVSEQERNEWEESLYTESDEKRSLAKWSLVSQYEYIKQYPDYLDTVQEQAERMQKFPIFSDKDSFSYRNIIKTGEDFKQREGTIVEIGMEWGIHVMSSYFVADLAVLIAVFLMIYFLFWKEKEKGLYPMIRCTRNGRGKLIRGKLAVLGIGAVVLCLLFYIPVVIICWKMFGFGNVNRSIQSLSDFRECILPLTVRDYIGLFIAIKAIAIVCFSYCIACFCIWLRGMGQVFAIVGVVGGIGYVCFQSIPTLSIWNFFKFANPAAFLDAEGIIGVYQNINLFGYPINRIVLTLCFLFAFTCIGITGAIFGFIRKNAVLHAASSSRIMEWIRERMHYYRSTCLIKQEWIRFFIQRKGVLLFIGIVWIASFSIQQKESFYETKVMQYRMLVKEFQGPLTDKMQQAIERRIEAIKNGEDPLLIEGIALFDKQYQTVLQSQEKSDLLGKLIDQTSWEYTFFSPKRDYQQTLIWVAVVIFIVISIFGSDYRKNEICLLQTTKKGRSHLSRIRMGISMLLAIAIGMLMRGVIAWNIVQFHPIGDCMAPAWSIPRFEQLGDLPIWSILVAGGALKILGILVVVSVMACLVLKIKKQTIAMVIGLLVLEGPIFIEVGGISSLRLFTIANAFYPYELLAKNPGQFAIYFTVLLLIVIVCTVKIRRREQYISK